MKKVYTIFTFILALILSLSFVSSNFVCGIVNDSEKFSSSWGNVLIYQESNLSKSISCKVNPERKFCCDLDDLAILGVGTKVSAEVFDINSGFVSTPVSLSLTGEGYDIFPTMLIKKAITLNYPIERIFVNQSSILVNISLADNYNNLRYTINSSEGFFETSVCTGCKNPTFLIPLDKGRNEINFIAYGNKEISEKIDFYNLDYLKFNLSFKCDQCRVKNNISYIPSGRNITLYSSFNSSHNLSGDLSLIFPSEWTFFDSQNIGDFSESHKILNEHFSDENQFLGEYNLKAPETFFNRKYLFYQKIDNAEFRTNVTVFRLRLMPFSISNPFEGSYFNNLLITKCSPEEPIVLNSKEDYLNLVAIFPTKDILESYSNILFEPTKNSFTILTSLPNKDIDRIFLLFKVKNGENLSLYTGQIQIPLEFYEEDTNYTYYSAFVNQKGPFVVSYS